MPSGVELSMSAWKYIWDSSLLEGSTVLTWGILQRPSLVETRANYPLEEHVNTVEVCCAGWFWNWVCHRPAPGGRVIRFPWKQYIEHIADIFLLMMISLLQNYNFPSCALWMTFLELIYHYIHIYIYTYLMVFDFSMVHQSHDVYLCVADTWRHTFPDEPF